MKLRRSVKQSKTTKTKKESGRREKERERQAHCDALTFAKNPLKNFLSWKWYWLVGVFGRTGGGRGVGGRSEVRGGGGDKA